MVVTSYTWLKAAYWELKPRAVAISRAKKYDQ